MDEAAQFAAYQKQQEVALRYNALQTALDIIKSRVPGEEAPKTADVLAAAQDILTWLDGIPEGVTKN